QAQQPHRRRRARAGAGVRVGGRRADRQRRLRPHLQSRRRGAPPGAGPQPLRREPVRPLRVRRSLLPGLHQPAPGAVPGDGVRRAPRGAAGRLRRAAPRRAAARTGRDVPRRGAGGRGRRHPAVDRGRPRQRLPRRPRAPRRAARGLLRGGRSRHARSGRAAALGQAAHPHRRRPAARLPGVRRVRRTARPPRPGTPVRQRLSGTGVGMNIRDLSTPVLLVDADALEANLTDMAAHLPGPRLRPHVKAHKTTALAHRQAALGHTWFTCATVREVEGMAKAGLGEDLLLANEVLDTRRLGALDARVTVAIDSPETLTAAVRGGVREVLVDVNVGLPRCGIAPERAGWLADEARAAGLTVRGVMGYEGHLMLLPDLVERARLTEECMAKLAAAHADVGGEVVSGGGTGTYAMNPWVTED